MKLPNAYYDFSKKVTQLHMRPIHLIGEEVTDSAIRRLIVQAGDDLENLIMLCRADITSGNPKRVTKHLILITDALPTIGKDPEKATLKAVSGARAHGVTISLVGIKLDKRGEELAKRVVALGKGRLYAVRDLKDIGGLVLEDYYSVL